MYYSVVIFLFVVWVATGYAYNIEKRNENIYYEKN